MSIRLQRDNAERYWLVDSSGQSIGEANKFLSALKARGLSAHTIRSYGYDLVILYRWFHATGKNLDQLEVRDLLDFIDAQRQAGAHARSINRRLMTVHSFYRFCTDTELKYGNGAALSGSHYKGRGRDRFLGLHRIRPPKHRLLQVKTPQTLVEPLTKEQVRAFLKTLPRYRDLGIVYLMLFCGLRSQEVLQLKLHDICFEEKRIRVQGKGNKERMLPLPAPLGITLKRYLQIERPHSCATPVLFVVLQGRRKAQPMAAAGLRSLFRHRRKTPLLANANAHRWRHTFGTDMARAGAALPILQRLMGHSDPRVTLQYINLSMTDIAQEFLRAGKEIYNRYKQQQ